MKKYLYKYPSRIGIQIKKLSIEAKSHLHYWGIGINANRDIFFNRFIFTIEILCFSIEIFWDGLCEESESI